MSKKFILDEIVDKTKLELVKKKEITSFDFLERLISKTKYKIKDVKSILKTTSKDPYKLIAEIKKASPSKGLIRKDFNVEEIAKSYEKAGANAISVLTEEFFFLGHLDYMKSVSDLVSCAILRKDFIIDKYQILEAKAYGADFILLIAKCLDDNELFDLYNFALSLDLEILVEVHDKKDLEKALKIDSNIIGINHRNLEDFSINMELSSELIEYIDDDKVKISESGISDLSTVKHLHSIGIDAFLIGEFFMREDDIFSAVKKIKNK